MESREHLDEKDPFTWGSEHQPRKRSGESQTSFAVRCVKAEAWAEGAAKASPHGGAYLRSILIENPYIDVVTPPGNERGGDAQ